MLTGLGLLSGLAVALAGLGAAEQAIHRRRLHAIPTRIHVNGTRGKSSVTRLIAAGLRAGGVRTCAKTTGTTARFILPDGREVPIFRPAGANIIEQRRIVAVAAAYRPEALVIECMALQPRLQSLCELRLVRSTHGVITNARPDHLDVMGPGPDDVAQALAGTVPVGGTLYTSERERREVFRAAAEDRGSALVDVGTLEEALGTADAAKTLARFRHTEHSDNVALALRVCTDLGVDPERALDGMTAAGPDPGATIERRLHFFGREIVFVNAFAANDPISTRQLWRLASRRAGPVARCVALMNCRADRPDRSQLLGDAFADWGKGDDDLPGVDHVVVMGTGTFLFADAAVRAGLDPAKLVFAEGFTTDEIFERVVALCGTSALVLGMGNIGGGGLELVSYFRNRSEPEEAA
ncbi:MAG: poly-gamma-glutamate synthase PgsB [Myxococcota bacterium]